MLPLGVVIPTKNSMAYLQSHVDGLHSWIELAAEVVIVDSHSTDGTENFLRENLKHPAVRFVTHPPGLYASWNFGIKQINSRFVFIATVGDTIERAGICRLVDAAEKLQCDVVVSKPVFRNLAGQPMPDVSWPVDDIVHSLALTTPRKLHKLEALAFATAHATKALTGSCASCVFRTKTLQQFPFPVDFGMAGDGAWALRHCAEVSWAVVPGRFSTFLTHPSNVSAADKKAYLAARRVDEVLRSGVDSWLHSKAVSEEELEQLGWKEMIATLGAYLDCKSAFDSFRHATVPWYLHPRAWQGRSKREQKWRRLEQLKRQALAICSTRR